MLFAQVKEEPEGRGTRSKRHSPTAQEREPRSHWCGLLYFQKRVTRVVLLPVREVKLRAVAIQSFF